MKTRIVVVLCGILLAGLVWLGTGIAQQQGATFVKQAMCIACHKAMNKDMVARYLDTKHAQAAPKDGMSPLDIYRRTVGFSSADNSYHEVGVGCQSCHGPGSAHLSAKGAEEKKASIVMPDALKTTQQKLSLCGRCHGDYTADGKPFAEGFRAGDDLFALPGFKLNEVTTPGPFQQLNDLQSSKHSGHDVTCLTCHTAHEAMSAAPQLRKPLPDLCLQCHATAHPCTVKADQIPAGANCATCHMPGGRHTFKVQK